MMQNYLEEVRRTILYVRSLVPRLSPVFTWAGNETYMHTCVASTAKTTAV